jgi:tRNA A-37 threonylcarbamoyl transferase component Bud32
MRDAAHEQIAQMVSHLTGGTLGRYNILEAVGRGGMATVFRAFDSQLGRVVALKVMPSFRAEEPAFLERFRNEARAVAQLSHPNILRVHDFGEDKGFTYLVMEFLTGGTIKDLLNRRLTLSETLSLLAPLADALDYAHANGVVHRDIKSSNIMLDANGNSVLTDFGLARIMRRTESLTREGLVIGTAEYMSPEQALGRPVDRRSDIYSLGVVAYQMMLGRTPFKADTPHDTLMSHIHQPAPAPRTIDASVDPVLEAALLKALAKDPADRYRSASEMVRALGATDPLLASAFDVAIAETSVKPASAAKPPQPGAVAPAPGSLLSDRTMVQISPQQARALALQHARENADFYGKELAGAKVALEVVEQEETTEHHVIKLAFKKAGDEKMRPGLEQITVTKAGRIERRQLMRRPSSPGMPGAFSRLWPFATKTKVETQSIVPLLSKAADFLTNPRYHTVHAIIITFALLVHLATHYGVYYPPLRETLGNLPYFRLHVLHESEFLLIIVYSTVVFRWKGGLTAMFITAITSIPFTVSPYIFGRAPEVDQLRDNSVQVAFIMLMGGA